MSPAGHLVDLAFGAEDGPSESVRRSVPEILVDEDRIDVLLREKVKDDFVVLASIVGDEKRIVIPLAPLAVLLV